MKNASIITWLAFAALSLAEAQSVPPEAGAKTVAAGPSVATDIAKFKREDPLAEAGQATAKADEAYKDQLKTARDEIAKQLVAVEQASTEEAREAAVEKTRNLSAKHMLICGEKLVALIRALEDFSAACPQALDKLNTEYAAASKMSQELKAAAKAKADEVASLNQELKTAADSVVPMLAAAGRSPEDKAKLERVGKVLAMQQRIVAEKKAAVEEAVKLAAKHQAVLESYKRAKQTMEDSGEARNATIALLKVRQSRMSDLARGRIAEADLREAMSSAMVTIRSLENLRDIAGQNFVLDPLTWDEPPTPPTATPEPPSEDIEGLLRQINPDIVIPAATPTATPPLPAEAPAALAESTPANP
jgi:hypothetical protein